jgi:hypothetical protein
MVGSNIGNMIVGVVVITRIWGFRKIKMKLLGTLSIVKSLWSAFTDFTVKRKIHAFIRCMYNLACAVSAYMNVSLN